MWKDFAFAFRTLRNTPSFTTIAILSLSLGVGANTAIFSFVNSVLIKQLPVPEPDRLVMFAEATGDHMSAKVCPISTIADLANRDPAFAGVFGRFATSISFSAGDASQSLLGELVTGQYFQTLNTSPVIGRLLNDEDVINAAANPVCVLSYEFWQREFTRDPNVIGRAVFLNGHKYRVLGVTPRRFVGADMQHRFDLQIPASRIEDFMPSFRTSTGMDWRKLSWLSPMARLKHGVTKMEAQVQTRQLLDELEQGHGETSRPETLQLQDGSQGFNTMRTAFGHPLLVLMEVVGVVLLVACVNLANLLLARAEARAKEFAIRMSIGASRSQLVRQLLTECLLLSACGGLGGLLLSFWITQTLLAFLNTGRSAASALRVAPDVTVFAFCIMLTFATVIVFGIIPALHATGFDLLPRLTTEFSDRAGQRGAAIIRKAFVVAQIALSLIVVFAAGLLTRTLGSLNAIDLGFKPDHVIALKVNPEVVVRSSREVSRIFDELLARVRAYPSVEAASLAASTPNGSGAISMNVDVPGYAPKNSDDCVSDFNFVSSSYFETLGQPLLRGRDFNDRDDQNSPRVAIVNRKFAMKYWGYEKVIGRKFHQGGSEVEIVSIVGDARDRGVKTASEDAVYLAEKQSQSSGFTVLVRTSKPEAAIPSLLAIIGSIDKRIPVTSVLTLDKQIRAGLSNERILSYLSSLFATLSTLLAGIGLYGILSYSVTRRTREIGVRFAIGAQAGDVAVLFARETLILLVIGLVIGGPLALLSVKALDSLLFGVTATDPSTLFLSVCALASASLLAISLPLWKAMRINPSVALHYE